ncbi:MAG: 50S ribosomal protein L18 [Elusimicrobia bacterium]|nr:50S ribosomal protein L18 [Elusimicrobiota bacterium]
MRNKWLRQGFRKERTRGRLAERPLGRPRLSVHRSLRYLFAQVIDDAQGRTVAAVSSACKEVRERVKSGKSVSAAKAVGEMIAKKAVAAGVKKVAFDRGALQYHGRVKTLADAARSAGLEF